MKIRLISSFQPKIRRIVFSARLSERGEKYSCDAAVYDGFDGIHRPVEVLGVACVDDADRAALHLVYLTGDHYAASADEFAAAYEPGHAVGAEGVFLAEREHGVQLIIEVFETAVVYTEIDAAVIDLIAAVQEIGGEAVFVVGDLARETGGQRAADAVKQLVHKLKRIGTAAFAAAVQREVEGRVVIAPQQRLRVGRAVEQHGVVRALIAAVAGEAERGEYIVRGGVRAAGRSGERIELKL